MWCIHVHTLAAPLCDVHMYTNWQHTPMWCIHVHTFPSKLQEWWAITDRVAAVARIRTCCQEEERDMLYAMVMHLIDGETFPRCFIQFKVEHPGSISYAKSSINRIQQDTVEYLTHERYEQREQLNKVFLYPIWMSSPSSSSSSPASSSTSWMFCTCCYTYFDFYPILA